MPEVAVTPLGVYNPTPTVRIDEQDKPRLSELIISMDVTEDEGGLARLELRLSNVATTSSGRAELAFEDERELALGANIALYAGNVSDPQEIFRGVVTGLEADFPGDTPPELVVLAEDALQRFRQRRRTRYFEGVSPGDLVRAIAQDHGIRSAVNGLDAPVGNWMQLNESDLAFLRRVLARVDGDLQVAGDELQVGSRQGVRRNELELELYSQLRSAKFLADLTGQTTRVTAAGWDPARGERVSGEALDRRPGPGEGRTGAELLRGALGPRSEHIGHIAVTTNDEASALAEAVFDQRARRLVRVDGSTEGNPRLRVGSHVSLTGISARFDNVYYVVQTTHYFDVQTGYETRFCAESHSLGNP